MSTIKYKLLEKYKNYVAASNGKVYKIKKGLSVTDESEITTDKLEECKYYYEKTTNTILVYLCILNEETGKNRYAKRQVPTLIGNTFHPFSRLAGNNGRVYQYKQIDGCFDNNHIDNLVPKVLLKNKTKQKKYEHSQKGYIYYPERKAYLVRKTINGIRCFVGWFKTPEEAKQVYDEFTLPSEKLKERSDLLCECIDEIASKAETTKVNLPRTLYLNLHVMCYPMRKLKIKKYHMTHMII